MATCEESIEYSTGQLLPNESATGTCRPSESSRTPLQYDKTQMGGKQNFNGLNKRGISRSTWWYFGSQNSPLSASGKEQCIDWEYASQGVNILNQAYNESTIASIGDSKDAVAALNRRHYLQAATFILRALPADLTREELLSLQAAGPASMLKAIEYPTAFPQIRPNPPNRAKEGHQNSTRHPIIFQRVVATMIIQILVVFQFLLPYIKLFVGIAYRWECEHKFAQQIVRSTMRGCRKVVRGGRDLSRRVSHLSHGRVERAIKCATIWCVQGLIVGIQQGILEGVDLFEAHDALW